MHRDRFVNAAIGNGGGGFTAVPKLRGNDVDDYRTALPAFRGGAQGCGGSSRNKRAAIGRASRPASVPAPAALCSPAALVALVIAFLAALLTLPARAALFGDDEARKAILEIRARAAEQEKRLQDKDAELARRLDQLESANRAQLEFANTIESLRREIANLRGEVERMTKEVATLQTRNRDLYGDIDARLKKLEPVAMTIDGRAATVDRNEQAAYDAALAQFRAGDHRAAATNLQAFVARYPQSVYAASAQYWLGNALYALKDYKSAIAAQQVVVERYRDSPRAPDALLNIASSQLELNQKTQSQATLQRILKEFPDSEAAKTARDRLPATAAKSR